MEIFIIVLSVLLGAVGQVFLKIGANKLGTVSFSINTIISDVWKIVTIPQIILGLVFFGASFLLWIKVLTKKELSFAYPMVSLSYVLIVILSYFLFKEAITLNKLLGVLLIIAGVFIINK